MAKFSNLDLGIFAQRLLSEEERKASPCLKLLVCKKHKELNKMKEYSSNKFIVIFKHILSQRKSIECIKVYKV